MHKIMGLMATIPLALVSAAASATEESAPARTRVMLGVQLTPKVPGAKDLGLGPFIEVARTRGDTPFEFEAPDESFGFPILSGGGVEFGPALSLSGKRNASAINAKLPTVSRTFEAGAFAEAMVTPGVRLRGEVRRGIGGHDGWVGEFSADAIARDGDAWLVSLGPRVTLADARYHRAWYGVTPAAALTSGLAPFRPGGGVSAVGVAVGGLVQLDRRWGLAAYARYDRLVGDAADSPITRGPGSRGQPSVGIGLSYIFGGGR
jgi:outer membrane protein